MIEDTSHGSCPEAGGVLVAPPAPTAPPTGGTTADEPPVPQLHPPMNPVGMQLIVPVVVPHEHCIV